MSLSEPWEVPVEREAAPLWVSVPALCPSLVFWEGMRLQEGSWVCDIPFSDAKGSAAPETVSPESPEMTQEQLLGSSHLMAPSGDDLPILWNAISNYQSARALEVADAKTGKVRPGQGDC